MICSSSKSSYLQCRNRQRLEDRTTASSICLHRLLQSPRTPSHRPPSALELPLLPIGLCHLNHLPSWWVAFLSPELCTIIPLTESSPPLHWRIAAVTCVWWMDNQAIFPTGYWSQPFWISPFSSWIVEWRPGLLSPCIAVKTSAREEEAGLFSVSTFQSHPSSSYLYLISIRGPFSKCGVALFHPSLIETLLYVYCPPVEQVHATPACIQSVPIPTNYFLPLSLTSCHVIVPSRQQCGCFFLPTPTYQ